MTQEITVTLEGSEYAIGRLDALDQFHVARRMGPLLAGIKEAFGNGPEITEESTLLNTVLGPVAEILSKMTDEDTNYVIFKCLSVVKRRTAQGTWAPMMTRGNQMMYKDISMATMLGLTYKVIEESLTDFFGTEPQPSPAVVK